MYRNRNWGCLRTVSWDVWPKKEYKWNYKMMMFIIFIIYMILLGWLTIGKQGL
jgi:hypothetical protein